MVHRPSDSRLLTNLLTYEKEYDKHLQTLLDTHSQQSLSSFAAYASASPAPVARAIIAVAGSLAGADDALRRYAESIEAWQAELRALKELEEEVGNVVRDREILVTRLIKLSKNQKPTRDSFVGALGSPPTTLSQTSLNSVGSVASPSSTKLGAAQAELQACESHLAAKERELDALRVVAVRRGLQGRCKAMVECGWTWGEMGKEGLRALEGIEPGPAGSHDHNKPLPDPDRPPGSDLSSLGPSQSASQIFLPISPLELAADHDQTYGSISPTRPRSPPLAAAQVPLPTSPTPFSLNIPPAHAISEFAQPPTRVALGMERRITEETEDEEASSSEEDARPLEVVENTRFASASQLRLAPEGRRFSLRSQHKKEGSATTSSATGTGTGSFEPTQNEPRPSHGLRLRLPTSHPRDPPVSTPTRDRERKTSGFFGSIAGLFRGSGGGSDEKWKTRTAQNVRSARRGGDSDNEDDTHGEGGSSSRWAFRRRVSDDGPRPQSSPSRKLKRRNESVVESHVEAGWISDGGAVAGAGARKGSIKKTGLTRRQTTELNTKANSSASLPLQSPPTKPARPMGVTSPMTSGTSTPTPQPRPRPRPHQPPKVGLDSVSNLRMETVGRSGDLSRQSSVRSSTSVATAPVNGSGRQTLMQRSSSTARGPSNGISPSKSTPLTNGFSQSTPPKSKAKAGTWSSPHPDVGRGGQMSLMAIVEGVSRDNRAGWDRASSGVGPLPNGSASGGGLVGVRAPPSVNKYNIRGEGGRGIAYETVLMPSGSAPAATLSRSSSARVPKDKQESPVQRSASVASPKAGPSKASSLPAKPLRSALRNPSPPPRSPPPPVKPLVVPAAPPKLVQAVQVADDDDTSSISSYATGREEIVEEEEAPPPPPRKDAAGGGSDLSTSTIDANGPARRKSVRMSLKPTFSPTPPAVDDEDGDVWGTNGDSRGREQHKMNGGFKGGRDEEVDGGPNIWEDSSSEDEEYARARGMLKRAGRKKW